MRKNDSLKQGKRPLTNEDTANQSSDILSQNQ